MSDDNFRFPIPKELLESFIKDAVSASIIGALGDGTKIITQAVRKTLRKKVDRNGNVSNYSGDNKYSLVDILAQKEIQKVVLSVLEEYATVLRPKIEEDIRKALNNDAESLGAALYERYMEEVYRELRISLKPKVLEEDDD